ncbi:hypothetical protein D3C76_10570 [compost metagenome]
MNIENLTQEEIELIKKHREEKAKLELKIKFRKSEEKYWDCFHSIDFNIKNEQIKISTSTNSFFPKSHLYAGKLSNGNGYFSALIPREEIVKMKDFFEYYLENNK